MSNVTAVQLWDQPWGDCISSLLFLDLLAEEADAICGSASPQEHKE